jgi:formamidopyrimidine-DNA glycosylase
MPELPEVETVRRGLEPALVGAQFKAVEQRRPDLRFPLPERFAERLTGRRVERLERRAKYLMAWLDSDTVLAMHLGMSGRFTIIGDGGSDRPDAFANAPAGNPAHDHIVFHMSNGATVLYNDVRRFGYMDLIAKADLPRHKLFRDLGVEPLGEEFSPGFLAQACRAKRTSLKAALLDQRLIAGLGNIYVCEALYRAKLSPRRGADSLATKAGAPAARAHKLVAAVKGVLGEAIEAGGSSLRDFQQADGSLGYFQHSFAVYGRAGLSCARKSCRGRVQRIVQNGRSTFFCASCQR